MSLTKPPDQIYDESLAFLSAAKGEPYAVAEWEREVARLEAALKDARARLRTAQRFGYAPAARFE